MSYHERVWILVRRPSRPLTQAHHEPTQATITCISSDMSQDSPVFNNELTQKATADLWKIKHLQNTRTSTSGRTGQYGYDTNTESPE